MLIVVTVHEVAWQLAGSSLRPMLSREQAGPLPAVSSNQERHQVHGRPGGESWLQGRVYFLSSFGTFLQLLFWLSTLPKGGREQEGLVVDI